MSNELEKVMSRDNVEIKLERNSFGQTIVTHQHTTHPFVHTNWKTGVGLNEVVNFILERFLFRTAL